MKKLTLLVAAVWSACIGFTQPTRWQQAVKYSMNIDMDVNTNRFSGKQKLEYTNNSPDVLNKVFYHLYFNAFQPGSSMDVRSQELGKVLVNGRPDWDGRVKDRISKLKDDEMKELKKVGKNVVGAIETLVKEGREKAMSVYNGM